MTFVRDMHEWHFFCSVAAVMLTPSLPFVLLRFIMSPPLSHGAVTTMVRSEGNQSNPAFQPVLQLIQVKQVGSDRFRVRLQSRSRRLLSLSLSPLSNDIASRTLTYSSIVDRQSFPTDRPLHKACWPLSSIHLCTVDSSGMTVLCRSKTL